LSTARESTPWLFDSLIKSISSEALQPGETFMAALKTTFGFCVRSYDWGQFVETGYLIGAER
jgi:hypothetical protein